MTRTLYYTTGGQSTVSHRGGPGSIPSQFMWVLRWGKNATSTGFSPSNSGFPSVPAHKCSVRIRSSITDGP